jgi:hypothetical protein
MSFVDLDQLARELESALGQKRKFSLRAIVVCFTPGSRHSSAQFACPLSAKKRHRPPSLDDLVGAGKHRRRNVEAERLGRFHVDHELELGRLLNR